MKKHEIFDGLARAVVNMDTDSVINLAQKSLEMMIPAEEAIENGLSRGMEIVGDLFAAAEYFVPEVVVCADTMYAGLNILKPAVIRKSKPKGKIVIGVVEGDTHDIGKNIVAMMLEAGGFEVIDLGRNVPLHNFSRCALEVDADIIALSSLMTTTMEGMKQVVDDVSAISSDRRPYVLVGGAPITPAFARRIGADAYAPNANAAVKAARELLGLKDKKE